MPLCGEYIGKELCYKTKQPGTKTYPAVAVSLCGCAEPIFLQSDFSYK
jgi:hypothetical protein